MLPLPLSLPFPLVMEDGIPRLPPLLGGGGDGADVFFEDLVSLLDFFDLADPRFPLSDDDSFGDPFSRFSEMPCEPLYGSAPFFRAILKRSKSVMDLCTARESSIATVPAMYEANRIYSHNTRIRFGIFMVELVLVHRAYQRTECLSCIGSISFFKFSSNGSVSWREVGMRFI